MRQLDQVLAHLGTPPDRILVGHSYGGLLAVLHAHMFAGKVRGLVLVDPMNPRFVGATGDFLDSTVPHIEHPATAKDSAVARLVSTFDQLAADPEASDSGLAMPVVIVTAGDAWWGKPDIDRAWRASHDAIAKGGPRRRLVVADGSKHDVPAKRPDTSCTLCWRSLRTTEARSPSRRRHQVGGTLLRRDPHRCGAVRRAPPCIFRPPTSHSRSTRLKSPPPITEQATNIGTPDAPPATPAFLADLRGAVTLLERIVADRTVLAGIPEEIADACSRPPDRSTRPMP